MGAMSTSSSNRPRSPSARSSDRPESPCVDRHLGKNKLLLCRPGAGPRGVPRGRGRLRGGSQTLGRRHTHTHTHHIPASVTCAARCLRCKTSAAPCSSAVHIVVTCGACGCSVGFVRFILFVRRAHRGRLRCSVGFVRFTLLVRRAHRGRLRRSVGFVRLTLFVRIRSRFGLKVEPWLL